MMNVGMASSSSTFDDDDDGRDFDDDRDNGGGEVDDGRISVDSRLRHRGRDGDDDEDDDDDIIVDGRDLRTYFATCIPGLQDALASELINIGAMDVMTFGNSGVRFVGSSRIGMKSLLWCRTAHRIMELIASSSSSSSDHHRRHRDDDDDDDVDYDYYSGGIRNREDLYRFVRDAIHVPSLLGDGRGGLLTLSARTIYAGGMGGVRPNRELCHGHYTALTVKNALVDASRELREDGLRPDVDVHDADVPLIVVLRSRRIEHGYDGHVAGGGVGGGGARGGGDNRGSGGRRRDRPEDDGGWETVADVDLYRCLHSGGSLHRRGYRREYIESEGSDDSGEEYEEYDNDHDGGGGAIGGRQRTIRPSSSSSSLTGGGRGRRPAGAVVHRAAMKETLAAGLLLEAGWDKLIAAARVDGMGAVLVDPMTGSATLPTEAALIACDVAPGLLRISSWRGSDNDDDNDNDDDEGRKGGVKGDLGGGIDGKNNPHRRPPCTRWKGFGDPGVWDDLLAEATRRATAGMEWACSSSSAMTAGAGGASRLNSNVRILCNEKNPRAAGLALSSIRNAGVGRIVSLMEEDCANWDLSGEGGDVIVEGRTIFVCNPPWGLRLTEDIDESWVSLREFLRREAGGCESWVLSGNKDLTKILRMKKSRTVVVKTADEDLRWLQYHCFKKRDVTAHQQNR